MIAIIDYDMGNLRSVQKAFEKVGSSAVITRDPREITSACAVVLPGVGAFAVCMENLQKYRLIEPIHKFVESGKPFFGICLGLQLLFEESVEFGGCKGLGIVKGKVKKFPKGTLKVPHIGWNGAVVEKESPMFKGIENNANFYFVHSYYVEPEEEAIITSRTDYGGMFVSSIGKGNIFATQFHPEKSQDVGLRMLKNFTGRINGQ